MRIWVKSQNTQLRCISICVIHPKDNCTCTESPKAELSIFATVIIHHAGVLSIDMDSSHPTD